MEPYVHNKALGSDHLIFSKLHLGKNISVQLACVQQKQFEMTSS